MALALSVMNFPVPPVPAFHKCLSVSGETSITRRIAARISGMASRTAKSPLIGVISVAFCDMMTPIFCRSMSDCKIPASAMACFAVHSASFVAVVMFLKSCGGTSISLRLTVNC